MSCLRFGVFRRKVVAKTRVVMPDGVKNVLVVVFIPRFFLREKFLAVNVLLE